MNDVKSTRELFLSPMVALLSSMSSPLVDCCNGDFVIFGSILDDNDVEVVAMVAVGEYVNRCGIIAKSPINF